MIVHLKGPFEKRGMLSHVRKETGILSTYLFPLPSLLPTLFPLSLCLSASLLYAVLEIIPEPEQLGAAHKAFEELESRAVKIIQTVLFMCHRHSLNDRTNFLQKCRSILSSYFSSESLADYIMYYF